MDSEYAQHKNDSAPRIEAGFLQTWLTPRLRLNLQKPATRVEKC